MPFIHAGRQTESIISRERARERAREEKEPHACVRARERKNAGV